MSHEVENMFSANQITPWHGLGRIVTDVPFEQVLQTAGLDWTVSMRDLFLGDQTKVSERAIVRDSDNTVLGFAGQNYKPLQNNEALNFFKAFAESGEVTFETAGSLKQGKRIWILAALNRAPIEVTPGDYVKKYLMLSNGHDGVTGVRVGFTPIRVVCANTLAQAEGNKGESQLLRVFHSKNVVANLDNIKEIVNIADANFEASAEQYRKLATRGVKREDIEQFVKVVFYGGHEAITDREKLNQEKMAATITDLYQHGMGNQGNTAWDLYNAATQYLSYDYGRTQDTRLDSLWFAQGKALNQKALTAALELVAA